MRVNFGHTTADYQRHRAGFPAVLFGRLRDLGIGLAGQGVLDLGTGTGSLARGFAAAGASVSALDLSWEMLAAAREQAQAEGHDIRFLAARAEATALKAASFDVVAAGQCWHWFDRPAAASESRRLLRHGGRLVIAHFDWLPLPGNVVAATEALIEAHNPAWTFGGGNGFYPDWAADAAQAGFTAIETFTFDLDVPYSHAGWRGRIRASAGIGASLQADAVTAFDQELAALLQANYPAEPFPVPHRTFALTATALGR